MPVPTTTSTYPLVFPALDPAERTRRAEALQARHPSFEFRLDEVGVVVSLSTDRAPCEVLDAGQLTMTNQDAVKRYLAELAREMPDVPFVSGYGVTFLRAPDGTPRLSLRQIRDVPDVLASALPKTELTDAELLAKWAGSRVQWIQPIPSTAASSRRPIPAPATAAGTRAIPPGPRVLTTTERRVRGERPMSKRYIEEIERTTVMTRTAKAVEVRRVAYVHVDDVALGRDVFGSDAKANLAAEYGVELDVTGTD